MNALDYFQSIFSTVGVTLDIIGVLLLFKFGLPAELSKRTRSTTTLDGDVPKAYRERDVAYFYDFMSYIALCFIIAGFLGQGIGNSAAVWFPS